ncbi:MAG TPA: ribosome-associated translation inhibitor RaiA [Candidatus Saccharimonadia bacterium]
MIQLQTTGRHYELDEKIMQYIDKKLGGLDRYLPRGVRGGLAGKVILECNEALSQDERCICEVQFEVKGEQFKAHESTINMYAAIDICEQKLKSQALTYKSKHEPAKNRRQRLLAKMLGRSPLPEPLEE